MLQGAQLEVKAKRTVIDFCVLISSLVRGKGLLNAIVIKEEGGVNAYVRLHEAQRLWFVGE